MQVTVHNRGPEEARLHVLPTLWFRHTWSWAGGHEEPSLHVDTDVQGMSAVVAQQSDLGVRWFYADQPVPVLVTGNETNNERVFGSPNDSPYVKDGIERAVVHGEQDKVNPDGSGTKAAMHYVLTVPAEGSATIRMRLTDARSERPFDDFDEVMGARRGEADEFYAGVLAGELSDDERLVSRQALAGMLWSKQYYGLDMERWLVEHGSDPHRAGRGAAQSRLAAPDRRGHHLDAGQVGVPVVRGVGPRLPRDCPLGRRHARSPSGSSSCCSTIATCTRTGSCRPTSGTSATSTRRCTRGRSGSSIRWRRPEPAGATAFSSRTPSRS